MDMDRNLNQSFNGSVNATSGFTPTGELQSPNMSAWATTFPSLQLNQLTREQLIQLQQLNQQEIQRLNTQLSGLSVTDNGTAYLDAYLNHTPTPATLPGHVPAPVTFPAHSDPYYVANVQEASVLNTNINPIHYQSVGSPTSPTVPLNISLNGSYSNSVGHNPILASLQSPVAYPSSSVGLNTRLPNQTYAQVNPHNMPLNGSARINVIVPNSLPISRRPGEAEVQPAQPSPAQASYSSSSYSSSPHDSPLSTPRTQVSNADVMGSPRFADITESPRVYGSRPRQQVSSPPTALPSGHVSDKSSTTSSIPSSPASLGHAPFSNDGNWSDSSGPKSPGHVSNGDLARSPTTPIVNKPLHMQTRYPQDKCYKCMKKVYPMEKLGPVRAVVYHKGCFRCKECQTILTMKSFFHNQGDAYDLHVYCKSHQPVTPDKGPKLGSDSLEIKAALNAPKQGKVIPESERTPVHKYSYDATSREIEHARRAPVADLQSANKVRNKAWTKSKREHEHMPPPDVVRHDEPVPEYDPESYTRLKVETNPDYR